MITVDDFPTLQLFYRRDETWTKVLWLQKPDLKKKNDPYAYDTGMALKEKHGFTKEQDIAFQLISIWHTF